MKIKTHFTDAEIKAYEATNDEFFLFDDAFSCCGGLYYKLTEEELKWLDFVRGRYAIADYIDANMGEDGFCYFDAYEFSPILDGDGMGYKAVCLSDYASLQRVFFHGYIEDTGDE